MISKFKKEMIQPHGGTLINRELPKIEKERILSQVDEFEKIKVNLQIESFEFLYSLKNLSSLSLFIEF